MIKSNHGTFPTPGKVNPHYFASILSFLRAGRLLPFLVYCRGPNGNSFGSPRIARSWVPQVAIYTLATPLLIIPFVVIICSIQTAVVPSPVVLRITLSDIREMLFNSIDPTEELAPTLDEVIDLLRVFVHKVVACAAINLQDVPEV